MIDELRKGQIHLIIRTFRRGTCDNTLVRTSLIQILRNFSLEVFFLRVVDVWYPFMV